MITKLLKTRFSVRKYQKQPVPDSILHDILESGRLSPSGGNEQPWMFGVITDPILITQIAGIAHQQEWIAQAPLLIVLCTVPVSDARGGRDIQIQRYPEFSQAIAGMDPQLYWSLNQEEHQTKIVGTHMALAALEHGVGSCWVSRFEVRQLADLLHLPENIIPAEILVMGYPAQPIKTVPKKSLEELVFYNSFHR
jgi:nitroreductase